VTRADVIRQLIAVGRRFDARGWVLGTSGNFSVVVDDQPLRLLMTASAVHKGRLGLRDFVIVDEHASLVPVRPRVSRRRAAPRPSAEALVHLAIVKERGARAVLHTHSIWSTLASERHEARRGVALEGFEMLKGLEGIATHQHREWVPIVDNSQHMPSLASAAVGALQAHPSAHGFLIRRHGLYTWGADASQAERHVEILEFLLEVTGRGNLE
jgi:methylthioribulose-1-phosphate dehydratase